MLCFASPQAISHSPSSSNPSNGGEGQRLGFLEIRFVFMLYRKIYTFIFLFKIKSYKSQNNSHEGKSNKVKGGS